MHAGFVAVSKPFYHQNKSLVELLWQRQSTLPLSRFYAPYREASASVLTVDPCNRDED